MQSQKEIMEQLKSMDPSMLPGLMSEVNAELSSKGIQLNRAQRRKVERMMKKKCKK
jgi:hypothetical protein